VTSRLSIPPANADQQESSSSGEGRRPSTRRMTLIPRGRIRRRGASHKNHRERELQRALDICSDELSGRHVPGASGSLLPGSLVDAPVAVTEGSKA
jgi:hypothetical protein